MKIFLISTGPLSKAVAEALYGWLPLVMPSAETRMSAAEIFEGARWSTEIASEPEAPRIGIICVTRENMNAPKLRFAADILSKISGPMVMYSYLFDMEPDELTGPLARFQAAKAEKEDTRQLLRTINLAAGELALPELQFEETFKRWWPRLERNLKRVAFPWTPPRQPVPDVRRAVPHPPRPRHIDYSKPVTEISLEADIGQLAEEFQLKAWERKMAEARQKSLMRKRVSEMLAALSEQDRKILQAVFIENRDKDDVVREFAVSRDYLRALLHRALRLFRELYDTRKDLDFRK